VTKPVRSVVHCIITAVVSLAAHGCAGEQPAPKSSPPPFMVCHGGCHADFDRLAQGERGVLVRSYDGSYQAEGELTPAGEQRAKQLAARLSSLTLRETYGCPGCADGPVLAVTLGGARHLFDPAAAEQLELADERNALTDAAQLFSDIQTPLTRCESNEWVRPVAVCTPIQR
jgi:hypothetical protein